MSEALDIMHQVKGQPWEPVDSDDFQRVYTLRCSPGFRFSSLKYYTAQFYLYLGPLNEHYSVLI